MDYRMGFVVGYKMLGIQGDNIFYVEEILPPKKQPRPGEPPIARFEVKIFQSQETVQRHVEHSYRHSLVDLEGGLPNPRFWRAWKYSTDNPENAKGMPIWTPEDEVWH